MSLVAGVLTASHTFFLRYGLVDPFNATHAGELVLKLHLAKRKRTLVRSQSRGSAQFAGLLPSAVRVGLGGFLGLDRVFFEEAFESLLAIADQLADLDEVRPAAGGAAPAQGAGRHPEIPGRIHFGHDNFTFFHLNLAFAQQLETHRLRGVGRVVWNAWFSG